MRPNDFDRSPGFRYGNSCLIARAVTFTIKVALRHYTSHELCIDPIITH